MRDRTYQLFQRCYLATVGLAIGSVAGGFFLVQRYITVHPILDWQWGVIAGGTGLALTFLFVSLLGSTKVVDAWVDPLKIGTIFEAIVIGVGFPMFGLVWVLRKLCFWRQSSY